MDLVIKLIDVLKSQSALLDEIYNNQKELRQATRFRNWENLENILNINQVLSDKFVKLEEMRVSIFEEYGCDKSNDIYHILPQLSVEYKKQTLDLYHKVRQQLLVCKVENESINQYIKITQEFLQGVFDNVMPQRRNVVYSIDGIVRNQPESLVLSTVL